MCYNMSYALVSSIANLQLRINRCKRGNDKQKCLLMIFFSFYSWKCVDFPQIFSFFLYFHLLFVFFFKWNSSNEVYFLYHQINYILISISLCCGRVNDKKFFTPLISGNKTTFFGLICHYLEETFHSFENYCLFSFYLFHIPKKNHYF